MIAAREKPDIICSTLILTCLTVAWGFFPNCFRSGQPGPSTDTNDGREQLRGTLPGCASGCHGNCV